MDKAADIIQTALDSMGTDVTVLVIRPSGRVTHVDGELTGLGTGPVDTITVKVDGVNTLVSLDDVIAINPREE